VTLAPHSAAPACALPDSPLAAELPGLRTCVHCGFCLQACPTYTALGDENDSPRGRLVLMRALIEGELAPDDSALSTHIERCLGCRACETACPSGVPYGRLLEATRATLAERVERPAVARLVLAIFARPPLLRLVLALARGMRASRLSALGARLPGRLGAAAALLESTRPAIPSRGYEAHGSGDRGAVALLRGCVMDGLFAETNRATARTLIVNGYEIREVAGQRCCGALHAHAGDLEGARALARANIAAFERTPTPWVAVNASGCGAHMKEYGHLLSGDIEWSARAAAFSDRVRDVSELLAAAGPVQGGALEGKVAYDAPCHLLHAQRIAQPPLAVLDAIPQLDVGPLADADRCCGGAGIYNLLQPDLSARVLEPKLEQIDAAGVTLVATGNPGCAMQIGGALVRRGARARVVHLVDLLDASYAARRP